MVTIFASDQEYIIIPEGKLREQMTSNIQEVILPTLFSHLYKTLFWL